MERRTSKQGFSVVGDRRRPARRHGGVYVAVLGVGMIVAIVGLAAIHHARVELDSLVAVDQTARAELMAHSAAELAIARLKADSNWRTTYVHNQENPAASWTDMGGGDGFKFIIRDDDGNLSDSAADHVTVIGVGRSGKAISVVAVELEPSDGALNCLDVSLHSGANLVTSAVLSTNQMVSGNAAIFAAGGSIAGDAWAVGNIIGTVTGANNNNMTPARQMPDPAAVFDYYLANGTVIDIDSIPSREIRNVVLSADNNPYGAENPQGIYVIDTEGQQLRVRDSRLAATLIVINSSIMSMKIDGNVHWEPPAPNYPALMTSGGLNMNWQGAQPLSESGLGINFNPSHTPYLGIADSDVVDVYPGVIKGLIYVNGNLAIQSQCALDGITVIGGATMITNAVNLTYDSTPRDYPPPGFSQGNMMRIVPGSWRRTVRD